MNPIELEDPSATRLGEIEGQVSATKLFDDFVNNQTQAKRDYVGKTYLITGLVLETFELNLPHGRYQWGYTLRPDEHLTVGIMLLPETPSFLERTGLESLAEFKLSLPMMRIEHMRPTLYEKQFADLLKAKQPDFQSLNEWDFSSYSDDFSMMSRYGGIYCMFAKAYHARFYGFPEQKRKVTIKCRIREFQPGGVEKIASYKLEDRGGLPPASEVRTSPRVTVVGCEEIRSEME